MRRKEKEITDKREMGSILKTAKFVTLAMVDRGEPYLVTLTHYYDDQKDAIYFHCAQEGRKVRILREDNRVYGQALLDRGYVEGKCDHLYATVQFSGKASFVQDVNEKRQALVAMITRLDPNPNKIIAEQITNKSLARVNIGRIDIDSMTGKRSEKVIVSM